MISAIQCVVEEQTERDVTICVAGSLSLLQQLLPENSQWPQNWCQTTRH